LVLVKNLDVLSIAMHLQHLVEEMIFDCNMDLGFTAIANRGITQGSYKEAEGVQEMNFWCFLLFH
jgi:hypothetical protein